MRLARLATVVSLASASLLLRAQTPSNPVSLTVSAPVTVPVTLDHNRIVIDVYVPLKDGTTKRVRGLVDTGSTDWMISRRVAELAQGGFSCTGAQGNTICSAIPPAHIRVGTVELTLPPAYSARMPMREKENDDVMIPGMSPEVVIPSSALKKYDIVIDYANRQFTIGPPGSVKFAGTSSDANVSDRGLVTVAAKVNGRDASFGVDSGLSATLVHSGQLSEWHKTQPGWPFLAGAIGAANMTGERDELSREMLRVPSLQLGGNTLPEVLVASGTRAVDEFAEHAHATVAGLLGGEALRGSKVGIDYAHGKIYLDRASVAPETGIDVVGLTVRPEVDGKYTIVAVVPYEGKPSVADVQPGDFLIGVEGAPATGATMGQVWSLLGGEPGQVRKLVIERDGKRLTVDATVKRWMARDK